MAEAPKKGATSQRDRFIEAARKAGADEDEAAFERRLKAVAGGNSSAGAQKPKAKKPRKK